MTNGKPNIENIIQLLIAAVVVLGGMGLLYLGATYDPEGQIHETVLVAFGEAATFAGSLIGIDVHYKYRYCNDNRSTKSNQQTGQESVRHDDSPPVESAG